MALTLDYAVQLHEAVRIIYVVDGYEAQLWTHDEARLVALGKGETIADALAVLDKWLSGVKDLRALRAMPAMSANQ